MSYVSCTIYALPVLYVHSLLVWCNFTWFRACVSVRMCHLQAFVCELDHASYPATMQDILPTMTLKI